MRSSSPSASPVPFERPAALASASALDQVRERGQSLERQGQLEQARALYETALVNGTARGPVDAAQLMRWVARTFIQQSEFDAARDCAEVALAVSELAGDEAGLGYAENITAIVEWKLGNLDEAQRLFRSAHESAHLSGELRLAAMAASNLGVIASVRGNDREARRYFESGLTDARNGGLADQAIAALVNLGLLHTQLQRYPDADRAFAEAREIATAIGEMGMLIIVKLDVAKLRIHQGRHDEARALCRRAREIADQTGNTHADAEAALVEGMVAHALGELANAESLFLRAEEIAIQRGDIILQGESARELAGLYRKQDRNRQALERLNQAHTLFSHLRARRELADVGRRTAMLQSDFLEVVRRWGDSIESKDVYTQGHCVRVADLACALWTRVGNDDATSLFWFRIGALLHDVGKLMIPGEVLNKVGRLTAEEWDLVRGHPSAGVELLAGIEFPWDVRPIVQSHHERWDGTGYPHRLVGTAIPLIARVVCIADVYDALTSQRSYKARSTHAAAMAEMRKDVGGAFDPELFEQFEALVADGRWPAEYVASHLGIAV